MSTTIRIPYEPRKSSFTNYVGNILNSYLTQKGINDIMASNKDNIVTIRFKLQTGKYKIVFENQGDMRTDLEFYIIKFLSQEFPEELAFHTAGKFGITAPKLYELYLYLKRTYELIDTVTANRTRGRKQIGEREFDYRELGGGDSDEQPMTEGEGSNAEEYASVGTESDLETDTPISETTSKRRGRPSIQ